jgi:hypothetical protein
MNGGFLVCSSSVNETQSSSSQWTHTHTHKKKEPKVFSLSLLLLCVCVLYTPPYPASKGQSHTETYVNRVRLYPSQLITYF